MQNVYWTETLLTTSALSTSFAVPALKATSISAKMSEAPRHGSGHHSACEEAAAYIQWEKVYCELKSLLLSND